MENEFQFLVQQRFTRETFVEERHANDGLSVQNRNGQLRPQQLELLLNLTVIGILAVAAQHAARAEKETANPRVEGQLDVAQRHRDQADSGGGPQLAAVRVGHAEAAGGMTKENAGAIDPDNL